MVRAMLLLIGATFCFGLAAALFGELDIAGIGVTSWTALGTAIGLCSVGLIRGADRKIPVKGLLIIGLFNAAQIGLYLVSLQLAPVGLAASLHLTSPIWILGWMCITGQRRLTLPTAGVFALVIIGLALAGWSAKGGGTNMWLGLCAAVVSAWCLACMFNVIKKYSDELTHDWANGVMQFFGALLFIPFAVAGFGHGVSANDALAAMGIGLFLYAPGGLLCWMAIARTQPSVVAAFSLLEAPFAALIAATALGGSITFLQSIAILVIVAAALLEARIAPEPAVAMRILEE